MSELDAIQSALVRTARRRRVVHSLRFLWMGLFWGAASALLVLVSYKVFPLSVRLLYLAAILPVLGAAIGFLTGCLRKESLPQVARWLDQRQGLQERLSTALELKNKSGFWGELVLKDAAAHAGSLDAHRILPFTVGRMARWSLLLLLVAAGVGFAPEYRSPDFKRKQADRENIRETGRRVADLARRTVEKHPPATQPARIAMASTVELGTDLEKKDLTRTEALREISSAAEQLRARANDLTRDPAIRQMRQAARSGGGDTATKDALQKQIDSLKQQLGEATPEKIDDLKSRLSKLEQAARAMDSQAPGSADARKLGAQAADLARQAQALGIDLPQLDAAIQALDAQNTELFLKNLQASLTDLEKLSQMAKTLQALQQQADKIGRNLGEQLQKGQAGNARETLSRLAKQLAEGNLSPEQMKKILEEVENAVKPGENYGNVAELLKNAGKSLKDGKSGDAAQSLQAAAKELENLMQQFADAEMLMATLDALNQASMCIGTGQCLGLGRIPGAGKRGGKGPGVGTWSDASEEWDGTSSEMADNSGVQRPDAESRSGEAEPEPADPLAPSRVRGQFSPGGQMPTISLKGVGIKGESNVKYEQAAEAAQTEAQSALAEDKVPRAYRDTVKNYFDDLKK